MLKAYHRLRGKEAGCDEAGRGCFAGPVFAAAVILPRSFHHPMLNDSKQLLEKERDELRIVIEKEALSYAVASVCNEEIDRINILKASLKAMHLALDQLKVRPHMLLIDGNRFTPYNNVRHECVIKGDGIYASIAAASVLAKTYRDEYMMRLHEEFPHYGWDTNKGYGTPIHRKALEDHGMCRYHRKSWRLFQEQLELFPDEAISE
jgi:ribonuclease HII